MSCKECVLGDPAAFLESLEGDCNRADTLDVDIEAFGYCCISNDNETGFHPGQDADPHEIGRIMRAAGVDRFIFSIDNKGQFDMTWSVWVHKSQAKRARKALGTVTR